MLLKFDEIHRKRVIQTRTCHQGALKQDDATSQSDLETLQSLLALQRELNQIVWSLKPYYRISISILFIHQ